MDGAVAGPRRILHVGCGGDPLPEWASGEETRLDIDPTWKPHIVASMTDMGQIGEFDSLVCQHALEHLYPHEVAAALTEFRRVLCQGGHAVIVVPDLEDVRPTNDVLFVSPAGPVTGLDMIYGYRPMLSDNPNMAHHTGFTRDTLKREMEHAGFERVVTRRCPDFNLLAVGFK